MFRAVFSRRNFMKNHALVTIMSFVFVCGTAFAANRNLRRTPPPPRGESLKAVDCAKLADELEILKSMASEHYSGVNGALDDTITRLEQWHRDWSKMEGKANAVPANTFAPLKELSGEISELQNDVVWKTLNNIEERIDKLIDCVAAKKK